MTSNSNNRPRDSYGSSMHISVQKGKNRPDGIDPNIPFFILDREFSKASAFQHNWSYYRTDLDSGVVTIVWNTGMTIELHDNDAKRFISLLKDKDSYHDTFKDSYSQPNRA